MKGFYLVSGDYHYSLTYIVYIVCKEAGSIGVTESSIYRRLFGESE